MVQAPYRTERWQMLKYWLDFVATLYASIVADLEKRNPLRLDLDGDPGMNVGHWIYIIIGFVVLFAVLVALYPTEEGLLSPRRTGPQPRDLAFLGSTSLPFLVSRE